MTRHQIKITKKIAGLLAVVSLLIVFKDVFSSLIDKIIIPVSDKVEKHSITVLAFAILLILFAYLASGYLLSRKNYIQHPERSLLLVFGAIAFYALFRFDNRYVFYGIGKITYVDVAFITATILEILSYFVPVKKKQPDIEKVMGFVSDNPSKVDKLERTDYAELLLNKILATYAFGSLNEGSMTILLNERYGAGKSTFFNLIEKKAKGKIRTCVFKPWQTSDGGKITEELLRLLEEQYSISNQLGKQLDGYSKLLSGSEAKNVLGFASHLLDERNSLALRYESIKEMLQAINDPLLVLVDDVDRLQAEELLALLKLLRNAADFPNIVYLVAADKEAMSQMLETKGIKDADEYLKKFFSFELLFPIDDSYLSSLLREQVVGTLTHYYGVRYFMTSIDKEFLANQYIQYVFQSPRDIYRFINLLNYTLDLFKRYEVLEEVYVPDLLKLLLIQFISPTVYKILRDEMDLLLDVRGDDGRVHLKKGFKDIIVSRQYKKHVHEVESMARKRNGEITAGPDNEDMVEDAQSLFEIPAHERPNKEDIVSDLLRDLFYDTMNFQGKSRICYLGEYFKFFAGKYSKSELSGKFMKGMMGLQSELDFEKTMNKEVEQGKSDFLVHKLKQYIEDEVIIKDIPTVLRRCITIEDAVYRDWTQRQSYSKSPKLFYEIGQFRPVYSNLLVVDNGSVISDGEEIERFKAIYAENRHYAWLASSLRVPVYEDRSLSFVYGQELHRELKEGLIRRFIAEELSEKPFEREKIEAIPMLRDMYRVYWEEQFKEYVKKSPEPMAWLYMLLRPSGDLLQWDYNAYSNLVGDGLLDYYAKDSLGLEFPSEICEDLAKIGVNHSTALTATNFGHHPFLVEAKKWWDEKVNKNK